MEEFKRIGLIIKDYREKKGLQQKDLAKELGYSPAAISYFENGLRKIALPDLQKIANFLQIPMNILLLSFPNDMKNNQSAYMLKLRSSSKLSSRAQQSIIEFVNFAKQKTKGTK
ncbi:MAG: hypothetical protein A3K83_00210 [Omnitrophica WOR_2 bacterium RBG_13_44_8b]|nr:MAG: hypothetical protein A3K83_00210 [Omnitrophica WOR_2 bacterium RBG_13_44_8b]